MTFRPFHWIVVAASCLVGVPPLVHAQHCEMAPASSLAPVSSPSTAPGSNEALTARWQSEVRFAPDPVHDGQLTACLVGRVYFLRAYVASLLEGEGSLKIELADATQSPPRVLEQWIFDAPALRRILRKDFVGPRYDQFLPWSTYNPDIERIELKLAYYPKQGSPLYAAPVNIVLQEPDIPSPAPVLSRPSISPRTETHSRSAEPDTARQQRPRDPDEPCREHPAGPAPSSAGMLPGTPVPSLAPPR